MGSQAYTVTINAVPSITTATLPSGTVGTSYSQTVAETGGTGAITFGISAGTLPTGLSLNTSTARSPARRPRPPAVRSASPSRRRIASGPRLPRATRSPSIPRRRLRTSPTMGRAHRSAARRSATPSIPPAFPMGRRSIWKTPVPRMPRSAPSSSPAARPARQFPRCPWAPMKSSRPMAAT